MICRVVETFGYGSGPGASLPFDPYPDPYTVDYGLGSDPYPRSIPLICEQAQDEFGESPPCSVSFDADYSKYSLLLSLMLLHAVFLLQGI